MRARGSRVGAVVAAAVAMGCALGTPSAALGVPSAALRSAATAYPKLNSELVSVRQVAPGVQRYRYRYGPLVAAAGQNLVLVGPFVIQRPPGAGYMTRFRPNFVGTDGVPPPVDVVHLHHAQLLNLSQSDEVTPYHEGAIPTPQRIAGWAEEKTIAQLPSPYGYPVKASDVWGIDYMLHNYTPQTRIVYMQLDFDWVPAGTPTAANMKPAYPLWFDVRNGKAYPVFDIPRGSGHNGRARYPDDFPDAYKNAPKGINGDPNSRKRNEWVAPRDMTLVAGAGHLHPGGLEDDLDVVRNGKSALAFRSIAHYFDPNGPVSWDMAMGFTPPDWRVAVRKGDTLRVSTVYETKRASWYEDMGIMLMYYTLPQNGRGADPFTEKIPTTGPPTHGHLPEASHHGGGPTSLPDPSKLPDGATVQDSVGIANFTYTPGSTTGSGPLGLPPVVDPGNPLTFDNFDASASIAHTITSCRAPCNRGTGISYPLANGPVQFDSGQLGYGTPYLSAFAQRANWRAPANFKPGTYTYFCRIHPFMRGAFRVRGKVQTPAGGAHAQVRIASKRARVDRKGRVRVRLRCSGAGCSGRLALVRSRSGSTHTVASHRYSLGAGRSTRVRLKLGRGARRALKRNGRLRLTAAAGSGAASVTRSIVVLPRKR